MSPLVVVDIDLGNVGSVVNILRRLGRKAELTRDRDVIADAERIVLAGVGAFDRAMERLVEFGLVDVLNRKVMIERTPILGICLGMQMLGEGSEEGERPGLGWIAGRCRRFRFAEEQKNLRVPHMGWNTVVRHGEATLFRNMPEPPRFYFVHSYHLDCLADCVAATAVHGYEFVAAIEKGHIFGTQFHPEKSHIFGLRLLRNFLDA